MDLSQLSKCIADLFGSRPAPNDRQRPDAGCSTDHGERRSRTSPRSTPAGAGSGDPPRAGHPGAAVEAGPAAPRCRSSASAGHQNRGQEAPAKADSRLDPEIPEPSADGGTGGHGTGIDDSRRRLHGNPERLAGALKKRRVQVRRHATPRPRSSPLAPHAP